MWVTHTVAAICHLPEQNFHKRGVLAIALWDDLEQLMQPIGVRSHELLVWPVACGGRVCELPRRVEERECVDALIEATIPSRTSGVSVVDRHAGSALRHAGSALRQAEGGCDPRLHHDKILRRAEGGCEPR
jgi:hypothetical protein